MTGAPMTRAEMDAAWHWRSWWWPLNKDPRGTLQRLRDAAERSPENGWGQPTEAVQEFRRACVAYVHMTILQDEHL